MTPPPTQASDPVTSLADAMVVNSSSPPLIMLDEDFRVIAASLSFCRPFGLDCAVLTGSSILEMGNGE